LWGRTWQAMAKTLCEWKPREIEKKREKLAVLISRPAFYCRKCARAASKAKVLCRPRKLPGAAAQAAAPSKDGAEQAEIPNE
ncbi:MAG: hypothetical protein N2322_04675, partial [Terrimicrobiaceae bacterium]|nr:hypothetical protein [Terrimicrobiaceae bacterium]